MASNVEDIYPLSPLQQGMLFHALAEPGAGLYLIHLGYELVGRLSRPAFLEAWQRAVDRHPPLRTSFHWEDLEAPLQVVHAQTPLPLETLDWRDLPESELPEAMAALDVMQQRPFDFGRAPLMRLALVELADDRHYFTWTFHHILMEGWSSAFVLGEVMACYRAAVEGREARLPERRPFRDYILWLQRQDAGAAERYWRGVLKPFRSPTLLLPHDDGGGPTDAGAGSRYQAESAILSEDTTAALAALARRYGITLNTVVQGAWALLMGRYTGQDEVLFGATSSGRSGPLEGVESMVGLFINTLPMPVRVEPDEPLVSWLGRIQKNQVAAREFEWSSLIDIHGWSEVPRRLPLFETIVVFENWQTETEGADWGVDLAVHDLRHAEGGTGYPLMIAVAPGRRLSLRFSFDVDRFAAPAIHRMARHMETLLAHMAANPEQTVSSIPMLPAEERDALLSRNDTRFDGPRDRGSHHLFEAQARLEPDRIAAVFGEERITYRELDERANRLAHHLRDSGVAPEDLVGVRVDRSLDLIVALLGVMKSGGAYLPIDPALPEERVAFMLEDAGVKAVVTKASLRPAPAPGAEAIIRLDADADAILRRSPAAPGETVAPENLVYLMYTSGSTGKPKGVQIEHRSLTNFLLTMAERPGLTRDDVLLAVTTVSFDISALELFLPLTVGGRVVIAEEDATYDGRTLAEQIERHEVTVMQATPSTWRLLLDSGWSGSRHLKVLCGGEALPRELANRLADRCGSLWNMYGPTETTIWSTVAPIQRSHGVVSIGDPIGNTEVYVLDDRMRLVPPSVPGVLYIGGEGVARGYLNRPELTAERFVQNPFRDDPGARLYNTGDVARYLPDGGMECLGRVDHQVKVRGFRIEPGEIEAVLAEHDSVRAAAVAAREFGPDDTRLVAWVVLDPLAEATPSELRAFLRTRLPDYMVPSVFSFQDELPLTPNAKVDRDALPEPMGFQTGAGGGAPPTTPAETMVAEIWKRLLGVEQVTVDDNFFDLGGHSLLAMKVAVEVEKKTGHRVNPLKAVFLNLGQFARDCESAGDSQEAEVAESR